MLAFYDLGSFRMYALRLPDAPLHTPPSIEHCIHLPAHAGHLDLVQIQQTLQMAVGNRIAPAVILGAESTPVLWWLLSTRQWPQAQCWVYRQQQWLRIDQPPGLLTENPTQLSEPVLAANAAQSTSPAPQAMPAIKPLTQPTQTARNTATASSIDTQSLSDNQLQSETFKLAAWGPTPERLRQLDDFLEQACAPGRPDWLHAQLQRIRRNGENAYTLGVELIQVCKQHGADAAQQWVDNKSRAVDLHTARHLRITLEKHLRWESSNHQRHQAAQAQQYKSSVTVQLHNGQHPNSLHLQAPHHSWNIYVDETGEKFGDDADELPATDKAVGRLVALAIPSHTSLPELNNFHATDTLPELVDKVLQTVLDAPVGVLGFSVQDSTARHQYWLGQVLHLVRWTLLQLPVPTDAPECTVNIFIEQRGNYTTKDRLHVLADTLESEFRAIDAERFVHLQLKLAFMDKSHPMNGYVDAVAFTWGSPSSISKDRLKKSQLRGHCLVDAGQENLHHLFLSLSERRALEPHDWYALCSAASNDLPGGFLARSLSKLGLEAQQSPALWQRYLAQVQQHLQHKQYRLSELAHAVDWLKTYSPQKHPLPASLQLLLHTHELALHNHQGRADASLLEQCLGLALQLRDEDPALATEALLRIATASNNHFEFSAIEDALQDWLAQPVGVPGLLLYGKLQSTLGQIAAFNGQPAQALPLFDAALASFAKLSDPAQAQREQAQTRSYRLVAQLDEHLQQSPSHAASQQLIEDVLRHLDYPHQEAASRSLAHSAQKDRFNHYLWLRTLVCLPAPLQAARQAYVMQQHQWHGDTDHPWALIDAYRAWLLHDAGQHTQAQQYLQAAIHTCADASHGLTLQWMAEVLRCLAQALAVQLAPRCQPSATERSRLQQLLPHAPHAALADFAAASQPQSHAQLLQHLALCLPFNFH